MRGILALGLLSIKANLAERLLLAVVNELGHFNLI